MFRLRLTDSGHRQWHQFAQFAQCNPLRAVRRAQPQILLLFEGWTPKACEQVFAGNDAATVFGCHVCRRVLDNTPRRNNAGPPRAGNEAIYIQ